MKILLINNFYYNRGGDCTYLLSQENLLKEKGHEVSVFSMHHPQNFESDCSNYFVSYINYDDEIRNISIASGTKVLNRTIYSRESNKCIEKIIKDKKPDIAHIHNIHHHITPSIFYILKQYDIPIVWTLHDYSLICPNTSFLSNGKVCERCSKGKYFWPILTRCKKNSLSASSMAAMETIFHMVMRINKLVDIYMAPSDFLRKKFIEYGIDKKKIVHFPYFIDINKNEKENPEDFYLYVGRVSEEKGVKTLIDAAVNANSSQLKIVGGGPLLEKMMDYAKSLDKNNVIEFLGHKSRNEVINYIRRCQFVVVPSEWYENYPFAILEAFANGKPVIGSKIGGIPELVLDTVRGLCFNTGDPDDLRAAIQFLLNNSDLIDEMGGNAVKFTEQELGPQKHYENLIKIYEKLLLKKHD